MQAILAVTCKPEAPFDLMSMLSEVVSAAKQVLKADRGSVWLYDAAADQLVLEMATGIMPVRVPASTGLAGACARTRRIINVPDCYADERFNPDVDRQSNYRTRCMLTLPLLDHNDVLWSASFAATSTAASSRMASPGPAAGNAGTTCL